MAGLRVCGLWAKQGQDGKVYHEGSLGGMVVRVYENSYKKTAKDPDVVVYISQPEKRGQDQRPQSPGRPRITPRPQAPAPYKDHTRDSQEPPPYESGDPGPSSDDFPF